MNAYVNISEVVISIKNKIFQKNKPNRQHIHTDIYILHKHSFLFYMILFFMFIVLYIYMLDFFFLKFVQCYLNFQVIIINFIIHY